MNVTNLLHTNYLRYSMIRNFCSTLFLKPVRWRRLLWLTLLIGVTTSCSSASLSPFVFLGGGSAYQLSYYEERYAATYQLSTRPAPTTLASAEYYLQRYQPGPLPRVFQHSVLYDRTGKPIMDLFDEGRRQWVSLAQISPDLLKAVIAMPMF